MIEAFTLASGSSGNSLLIRSGPDAVLMDAGCSRRAIASALAEAGTPLSALQAIFITHEHSDHVRGLSQIAKHERIPIHAAAATADALCADPVTAPLVVRHPPLWTEQVGSLRVTSFLLPHDSLCHVGYVFCDGDGDAFCAATDIGHITESVKQALCGCRGALLEANHDVRMLRCGPYPAALKARILSPSGHLSNDDSASLVLYAAMHGVSHVGLGHLSAENNTPEAALSAVQRALDGCPIRSLTVCARASLTRIM